MDVLGTNCHFCSLFEILMDLHTDRQVDEKTEKHFHWGARMHLKMLICMSLWVNKVSIWCLKLSNPTQAWRYLTVRVNTPVLDKMKKALYIPQSWLKYFCYKKIVEKSTTCSTVLTSIGKMVPYSIITVSILLLFVSLWFVRK